MMYQKGTRAVKPIVYFIQGYCTCIWLEIAFVFLGCYNQYKARGCSYRECKSQHMLHTLALLGLVTNHGKGGGGATKQQGRQVKFYPYKKCWGGGWLKKLKLCWRGGHNTFWGSFNMGASSFSHSDVWGGGAKRFPPFKRRAARSFTLSCGGGGGKFRTRDVPIL